MNSKILILWFLLIGIFLISGCISYPKDTQNDLANYWKNKYESECYGTENMISQLQAENIAKHYTQIQVNLNTEISVQLSDIKILFDGPSLIGEACNPDWFVTTEVNDIFNKETYRFFLRISGNLINKTLQGVKNLPKDYVLRKVESDIEYHASYDLFPFIGGVEGHKGPQK